MADALLDWLDAYRNPVAGRAVQTTNLVIDGYFDAGIAGNSPVLVQADIAPNQGVPMIMDPLGNFYIQGFQVAYPPSVGTDIQIQLTVDAPDWRPVSFDQSRLIWEPCGTGGTNVWRLTITRAQAIAIVEGVGVADFPFLFQSQSNPRLTHDPGIRITPPTN